MKYTVYKRLYLIKIKSLLANFSFTTIIIMKKTLRHKLILLEKNNRLWRIHPFWIKLNKTVNKTSQFLQTKQDTIRQKRCQKYKTRWCKWARSHEAWHPSVCSTVELVLNWWTLYQPNNNWRHSNIVFTEI